ncbi:MAG TPA: glycosyltransferase [Thermoanaerobaculia bacterium]|nr:glycosyltransferase [Thermoanaerobaculia bacterium]
MTSPTAPRDTPAPAFPGLRVALVHDWLTGMRGGEKVLEELCLLFPGAPIHTLFHFPGSVSPAIESHPIRTSFLQSAPGARRRYRSYLPLFPLAIEQFELADFDLVVSSSHCVAKGARARDGALHVCYCHTPMRYAWDQRDAYFPERSGAVARTRHRVLDALQHWDARTSGRVDAFLANSSFVADRIRRYYGRESTVVAPPVDVEYFRPADRDQEGGGEAHARGGEAPYALVVAALAPYKRVAHAVEACERLGIELRIAGEGPDRERIEARAGAAVRVLGRVDDRALRDLYRGAAFLLQPGVEDFGIASVEALACGCPVIAAGQGGVLDIVEDGVHGLLYPDGQGIEGLKWCIDKALGMHFNILNLRERASLFSRERFRQRMRSVLQGILSAEGRE